MDFTASVFEEAAPGRNLFVGVDVAPGSLGALADTRVEYVIGGADDERLMSLIAESEVAVFHNTTTTIARFLATAPSSVLRVWSGWGGDYYGTAISSDAGLLGPATRHLVHSELRPTFWAGRAIHALRFGPQLRAAARAADVFSAPIPGDQAVFRRRFPQFQGVYSQLNYASVEDSISIGERRSLGADLLVGNSAAPTNNHLEVLQLLALQDLDGRRVLVPLSYGNQGYAQSVIREGRRLLGDSFVPITRMMPLSEYNELLWECGVVLTGAQRQAGLGNILRAVWQGAHLVLDRHNPVVDYLRDGGVPVTLLDDIPVSGLPVGPLSEADLAARRAFLNDNWGRARVLDNIRTLVDQK